MSEKIYKAALTLACMELQRCYIGNSEKDDWTVMQWEEYLINEAKQKTSEDIFETDICSDH